MLRRMLLPVLPILLVLGLASIPAAEAESVTSTRTGVVTYTYPMTTYEFENRLLYATNMTREKYGCARLRVNSALTLAARTHSAWMAKYLTLSHRLSGEGSLGPRISSAGYTNWKLLAENIAYGTPSTSLIYGSWMGSATHKAYIVNCRFRDVGMGVKYAGGKVWVTMDLGLR